MRVNIVTINQHIELLLFIQYGSLNGCVLMDGRLLGLRICVSNYTKDMIRWSVTLANDRIDVNILSRQMTCCAYCLEICIAQHKVKCNDDDDKVMATVK